MTLSHQSSDAFWEPHLRKQGWFRTQSGKCPLNGWKRRVKSFCYFRAAFRPAPCGCIPASEDLYEQVGVPGFLSFRAPAAQCLTVLPDSRERTVPPGEEPGSCPASADPTCAPGSLGRLHCPPRSPSLGLATPAPVPRWPGTPATAPAHPPLLSSFVALVNSVRMSSDSVLVRHTHTCSLKIERVVPPRPPLQKQPHSAPLAACVSFLSTWVTFLPFNFFIFGCAGPAWRCGLFSKPPERDLPLWALA